MNTGKQYERFVQRIQQAILDSEQITGQKNIKVEHNVFLVDSCDIKRQFDVYWEYDLDGVIIRNVIECKDYKDGVSIDRVDALVGKLMHFPGLHGILATSTRYDRGAVKQAQAHGLSILIVREEDPEKDWKALDGTPVIRKIIIHLHIDLPPDIVKVTAFGVSRDKLQIHAKQQVATDTPVIFDKSKEATLTIQDLVSQIEPGNVSNDLLTKQIPFDNAVLLGCQEGEIAISSIEIEYRQRGSIERPIIIAPEVLGVVEEITNARKRLVLKDGCKTFVANVPMM